MLDPKNALLSIEVIVSGIVVESQPEMSLLVFVSIRALQSFLLSNTLFKGQTFIELKFLQLPKALLILSNSMSLTLSGISIDLRFLHPANALSSIFLMLEGNLHCLIFE